MAIDPDTKDWTWVLDRVGSVGVNGARFSTHDSVAAPRHLTFWREGPLREVLAGAGWTVEEVGHGGGPRGDHWLDVLARRR